MLAPSRIHHDRDRILAAFHHCLANQKDAGFYTSTSNIQNYSAQTADNRDDSSTQFASPLSVGEFVGPYTIEKEIGSGGMARVYSALDPRGDRVAIKSPLRSGCVACDQIKREYRVGRLVQSKHIVQMHALYTHSDSAVLVQDLVEGTTSHQWIRGDLGSGQLPCIHRVEHFIASMAECLQALKQANVVHRDIKPDNIIIDSSGNVTLVDLGLATPIRTIGGWNDSTMQPGTFRYVAPEIVMSGWLDFSADMYSFGRCLFYMLAGRLPSFDIPSLSDWSDEKASKRIAQQLPYDTPSHLVDLCIRLHKFDPVQRPDVSELVDFYSPGHLIAKPPQTPELFKSITEQVNYHVAATEEDAGRFVPVLVDRPEDHRILGQAIENIKGDFSNLVLRCRVSQNEHIPLRAVDPVLSNLSQWLNNLDPILTEDWRITPGSEIEAACPVLGKVLASDSIDDDNARVSTISELLERIAQERIVIVSLENLEDADQQSWQVLASLAQAMPHCKLVVFASIDRSQIQSVAKAYQIRSQSLREVPSDGEDTNQRISA